MEIQIVSQSKENIVLQVLANGTNLLATVPNDLVAVIVEDENFRKDSIEQIIQNPPEEVMSLEQNVPVPMTLGSDKENSTFRWTTSSTKLLLDLFHSNVDKFRNPTMKKNLSWNKIAFQMENEGYCVSGETCDRKFRNLKTTYRTIKDN